MMFCQHPVANAGVAQGADTLGQRIRSGPGQVQSVLTALQKRIEEQRLLMALQVWRSGHCYLLLVRPAKPSCWQYCLRSDDSLLSARPAIARKAAFCVQDA